MKKFLVFISICMMVSFVFAVDNLNSSYESFMTDEISSQAMINNSITESVQTNFQSVEYSFVVNSKSMPSIKKMMTETKLPALSKTFALPVQTADLTVNSMLVETYNLSGELIRTSYNTRNEKIFISKDFVFKEMRGFTVFIDMVSQNNNEIDIIKEASFTLTGNGAIDIPTEISEAFVSSYRSLASNYDGSYLSALNYKKPSMIIVSHNGLADHEAIINFVNWKKSLGFDIHILYKEDAGDNAGNDQIKTMIRNKYNSLSVKPDYLLLIGNSRSGSYYRIPPFQYEEPDTRTYDATDLPYGTIVGNDFFPELLVGRFSFNLDNDLHTLTFKTRYYEMGNFQNTDDWMTRGLVIAANYSSGGITPTTPIKMSKWIANKMLESGYTNVDTLFDPQASTSDIRNKLNAGAQIVTYRGWGAANGWHYPIFYNQHLQTINNNGKLALVYSIVCDTGDYNHSTYNPSFGETFMNLGSSGQPNGAVAFVGPSFLYTSTEYNNSIGSGMMYGVFDEGIRIFGSSVMRGRIEIYNNYPREQQNDGIVNFYWGTYNILSDPSLNMWVLDPENIAVTLPDEVSVNENSIVIDAGNIDKGFATASKNGTDFTYVPIVDGNAILPLPNTDEGTYYRVTISARNRRPVIKQVLINNNTGVGVTSQEIIDGNFFAGQTATIRVYLKNFSDSAVNDISTVLSSNNQYLSISNSEASLSTLASGATANVEFDISLNEDCPDNLAVNMNLNINPSNHNAKFALVSGGYHFSVRSAIPQNDNQNIGAGESGTVTLTIKNYSSFATSGVTAYIEPLTDACSIDEDSFNIPDMNAGATANVDFTLNVEEGVYAGRTALFAVNYVKDDLPIYKSYFRLELGVVDNTAPTGPDAYGYFAYDSFDTDYPEAPTYNWVEINPDLGGNGSIITLSDDESETIDLPFDFKYYGNVQDQITICSNGWIAFGETDMDDFRNWNIPSALGPYNMLAVFFDDLKGQIDGEGYLDMEIKYWYDSANNRFIVQWDDTYFSSDSNQTLGTVKFQAILYPKGNEDGDIVYQYHTILNPSVNANYSTVGIENPTQSDGICYTFADYYQDSATTLQNGLAIKFTTIPPDNFVSNNDQTLEVLGVNLHQNYPNPFNPETNIAFDLKETSNVKINIYNVKGQKVITLVNERLNAGKHITTWNGLNKNNESVTSGIYFYEIKTDSHQQIKKMILLK